MTPGPNAQGGSGSVLCSLPHVKQLIHSTLARLYLISSRTKKVGDESRVEKAVKERPSRRPKKAGVCTTKKGGRLGGAKHEPALRYCARILDPAKGRSAFVSVRAPADASLAAQALRIERNKNGPARRLKAGPNLTKEQRYGTSSCIAPPMARNFKLCSGALCGQFRKRCRAATTFGVRDY